MAVRGWSAWKIVPRSVPGAADEILRTLERLGFAWDGEVIAQSRRGDAYA